MNWRDPEPKVARNEAHGRLSDNRSVKCNVHRSRKSIHRAFRWMPRSAAMNDPETEPGNHERPDSNPGVVVNLMLDHVPWVWGQAHVNRVMRPLDASACPILDGNQHGHSPMEHNLRKRVARHHLNPRHRQS